MISDVFIQALRRFLVQVEIELDRLNGVYIQDTMDYESNVRLRLTIYNLKKLADQIRGWL